MHQSTDGKLDLEKVLNYYFVEEMPKDIFFEIVFDLKAYYTSRRSNGYTQGSYSSLTGFNTDSEVLLAEERLDELVLNEVFMLNALSD